MGFVLAFLRIIIIGITMGAYLLWLLLLQWILGSNQERGFRIRRAWARLGTLILGIQVEKDIHIKQWSYHSINWIRYMANT